MLVKVGYGTQLATHNQHKDAETGQVSQEIAQGVERHGALRVTNDGLHNND